MPDYDAIAENTARMLAKSGASVTLRRTTPGTFNAAIGECDTATVATCTGYGVLKNYSHYTIATTAIEAGDMELLLEADGLTFSPEPDDQVIISTATWNVVSVKTVEPGGTAILHKVQVRR